MARIGFVGLGQMGNAMSRNLMAGGHEVCAFDVKADAVQAVVNHGAIAAASGKEAAMNAEVVFTMLPVGEIVERAVFGADGIVEGLSGDAILVDMSTILPDETRAIGAQLAERGFAMVDAPVGRTSAHAITGKSTFMVGGAAEDLERVRPFLDCMGEMVTHCGPLGAGSVAKLVNNYISAVSNLTTAEGMALGLSAGIDQDILVDVISQTPAGNGHIKTTWPAKALANDPSPDFMLDLARKDLRLALSAASSAKIPLATGGVAHEVYNIASALGHGKDDWSTGIYQTLKRLANLE